MFNHSRVLIFVALLPCSLAQIGFPTIAVAADKAQIEQAIERGKSFLLKQSKSTASGSLACYSLLKAGVDPQHPDIQNIVLEVLGKFRESTYNATAHHTYEAGVDAMLLEAVDRELYRPQLEIIARYLLERQRPHGGWHYPVSPGSSQDFGDTSISQYAILGLWAAVRAGVEVPIETWERAAKWLQASQCRDGGFTYHPNENNNQGNPTGSMTAAGTGSLLVIRYILFSDVEFDDGIRPVAQSSPKRFGVLERPIEEREKEKAVKVKTAATISASALDRSLKGGVKWIADHFTEQNGVGNMYVNYYYYGIERVGAVLDVEKIGTHDWYNEGADELLRRQAPDGSWNDSSGIVPATSLTLLFLTKATAKTIHKPRRIPQVGGGLLVGGRGLPDDLGAVKVTQGEIRKLKGPVDTLLADLEKVPEAKVEEAQVAIVEAVQLDRPEELIEQVDRLKRLSSDKRVEVRRTAMWALGRTGNISGVPFLIRGLTDTDEAVAREAGAALCIISRRPNGSGPSVDPTDGLAEEASDEQRATHLKTWGEASKKVWTDWYLKVRPYDERDDRTSLKRKPQ